MSTGEWRLQPVRDPWGRDVYARHIGNGVAETRAYSYRHVMELDEETAVTLREGPEGGAKPLTRVKTTLRPVDPDRDPAR